MYYNNFKPFQKMYDDVYYYLIIISLIILYYLYISWIVLKLITNI